MSCSKWTIIAVLLFSLLFGADCEAANWTKLGQTNEGGVITGYVDRSSLQEVPALFTSLDKFEIWEKWTYSPPRKLQNKDVPEILYFTQYRKNKQYCVKEIWYVFNDGSRTRNTFACEAQRIPPDSINELVWNYIFKTYVPTLE